MTTYQNQSLIPLSPPKLTAIQNWREQPERYYAMLPTATPRKMIEAETPTLWELRQRLGHPAAVAILVNAFIHAAKLVNLDKNLTIEQIGEAANDILEAHGYLKVEEVKFLLKRALRTQNVYGRLDYNVLMNWVEAYDAERTEEAIRISEQQESQQLNVVSTSPDAKSYSEYLVELNRRASNGDEKAAKIFKAIDLIKNAPSAPATHEQKRQKECEYKQFLYGEYLARK